jgi:hypothetical protein
MQSNRDHKLLRAKQTPAIIGFTNTTAPAAAAAAAAAATAARSTTTTTTTSSSSSRRYCADLRTRGQAGITTIITTTTMAMALRGHNGHLNDNPLLPVTAQDYKTD